MVRVAWVQQQRPTLEQVRKSRGMSSPVKQVPLASGSDDEPRPGHITTRAFFCGVVVEGAGDHELAHGEYGPNSGNSS